MNIEKDTETLTVLSKGQEFEIIVQHDQSGSSYGITLSKNAYDQLSQYFINQYDIQEMKKLIKDIKDVCDCSMSIIITDEIAEKILNENPSIRQFGANDTEERSNIIDFVCRDICGMRVPRYGDSKEYKEKFKKAIIDNATFKGYKLNEQDWNPEEEY